MTDQIGTSQYLRIGKLFVTNSKSVLDLSELRFTFYIKAPEIQSPKLAMVRVYNLKPETQKLIQTEYDTVVVNVGYQGGVNGVIFKGGIKQFRTGRVSAKDSYLDLFAADGDQAYINAFVKGSIAAPATSQKQLKQTIQASFTPYQVTPGIDGSVVVSGGLPRGKVYYGMGRDYMRQWCDNNSASWNIENGQLVVRNLTSLDPSQVVIINSQTGMVGVPELTDDGVAVKILINPQVQVGTLIQLQTTSINQTKVVGANFPNYGPPQILPIVSPLGHYKVLVCEYVGDTRGLEWYQNLTCLAVDLSAAADQQLQAYG